MLAERAGIRLAFIRVQRRPRPDGPPPQSEALAAICREAARRISISSGAYFHDDRGDPEQPLAIYADGDHLQTGRTRSATPSASRGQHARFFQ